VVRRLVKAVLAAVLAPLLRWSGSHAAVALVYHRVALVQGDPGGELVPTISVARFEQQVKYLARRYRVVPAGALQAAARDRRRGQRLPVAITFDDDLPSHRSLALPVLQAKGVSATVFLCGASLDGPHAFWWEHLERAVARGVDLQAALAIAGAGTTNGAAGDLAQVAGTIEALPPAGRQRVTATLQAQLGPDPEDAGLRAADVAALASAGMEIGFHTRGHDRLIDLDDDGLDRALDDGRPELEAACGTPVTVVAYPHGRADGRVAAAARRAGFGAGFTTAGRRVLPGSDPLLLGRLDPTYLPPDHFALWLARQFLPARRRS
jgi:peptidoglycan/xylan/chitin deacetylase (PgdA/CDA1 family)